MFSLSLIVMILSYLGNSAQLSMLKMKQYYKSLGQAV